MRVLSFCLYGDKPLYLHGAIMNARTAGQWYPDWSCRFYVGVSVPREVCEQLEAAGALVIHVDGPETPSAMLWRFRPVYEEDVQAIMVRDCDSRFGRREREAVSEWLGEGRPFHIMRDHPAHRAPILGGLWGATGPGLVVMREALAQAPLPDVPGVDQYFLTRYVYPFVKKDACIHDSYFCYERHSRPFPSPRDGGGFVGEIIDENEEPDQGRREEARRADSSFRRRMRLKVGSAKDMLLKRGFWGVIE